MKKILELIRFIGMLVCVYTAPLVTEKASNIFYQQYIPSHAEPLTSAYGRYCSGSHIDYNGRVLFVTNRHCCARGVDKNGKEKFAAYLTTSFKNRKRVLYVSDSHDVCIAASNRSTGLSISTKYSIGDTIRIVGYPRGMNLTVRKGTIFDIDSSHFPWLPGNTLHKYIHVSAIAYPGNSGSAVVDRAGRVIGLLFAGDRRYVTEGIVVPSEFIVDAILSLEAKEVIDRNMNEARKAVDKILK